jgi:pimeloyl-ACP methyl ester carboxylesterase
MDLGETFAWEGRRIAWGRGGSGPAVVFCHGTHWSSWLWRPFAEALSGEYTVYLWDMPGYGRSSKHADRAVDFGVQAEAFTALLEHWALTGRTSLHTTTAARSRCALTWCTRCRTHRC